MSDQSKPTRDFSSLTVDVAWEMYDEKCVGPYVNNLTREKLKESFYSAFNQALTLALMLIDNDEGKKHDTDYIGKLLQESNVFLQLRATKESRN